MSTMQVQERRQTPLDKAHAAHAKAAEALNALRDQERALQGKRNVLGGQLAREGKLTRVQRSELASVNRQIKALATPLKRSEAAYAKARAKLDAEEAKDRQREEREREKRIAREDAAKARTKAVNQRKLERRVAAVERRLLKEAGSFARLPQGAKPSRGTWKDDTRAPQLRHGFVTKEGRGKSARWVLVVTDTYGMAVLPLDVTGELPVNGKGAFIPPEALKAIDKTGAFRITKKGGVQPVKVTERVTDVMYEPPKTQASWNQPYDPTTASARPRAFAVEEVGTAFMLPDRELGKFVDHTQFVPKAPPAKVNTLEWAVDPQLLKQFAEALGAGSGSVGNVVVTFNLAQTGKASDGRRVQKAVTLQRYDKDTKRPVEGPTAVLMPVALAERKK